MSEELGETKPFRLQSLLLYLLMVGGTAGIFYAINTQGLTLQAPAYETTSGIAKFGQDAEGSKKVDAILHVLLALVAVVITGRLFGALFAKFKQPPVIGEVIAGIFLGPSILGRLSPETSAYVLPPSVAPYLGIIAQLGVILYMFMVGLELNASMLKKRAHATVAISHSSIIAPFILGSTLALLLYPRVATNDVPFTSFALFLGVAMSITAFPVLARILTDRKMSKTPLGTMALVCAATDDVTAWCLLALVVGFSKAKVGAAFWVVALTAAYIAFMFFVARPLIAKLSKRVGEGQVSQSLLAFIFVLMLLSSLATEYIGIHAIFGAFLLGVIIPHDSALAREFTNKLNDLVTVLLLPAFFAFTGMRTQIGLLSGWEAWALCGLIILVATVGKFGGTFTAARITGLGWKESAALGILMNTRGLVELVVLNIGLDLKVISPTLFAMMVLMAVVTTMATTPILEMLVKPPEEPPPPAEKVPELALENR